MDAVLDAHEGLMTGWVRVRAMWQASLIYVTLDKPLHVAGVGHS